MQTIDHTGVGDVKVKRVFGIARVMWMATLRFGHRNNFTHVFNDRLACGHVAQGKDAFPVHTGGEDFDARIGQQFRSGFASTWGSSTPIMKRR